MLFIGERNGDGNHRHKTFLTPGFYTSSRSGVIADDSARLAMNGDGSTAVATWENDSYQVGHLSRNASFCKMSVAIVGTGLTSPSQSGSADVSVDGEIIEHITFSSARRGLYPLAGGRLVPANVTPQPIELVALDQEYGFLIAVPQTYCSADKITIGLRVQNASWTIANVGIVLDYAPKPFSSRKASTLVILGTILIALGIASLYAVLVRFRALGFVPLAAAIAALALAPLTYDQWDFRLWLGFGETAIFGGGDPARLWFGSPFWTFVPSLFSTMTAAVFVGTGHGPEVFTAIFMKIGMALAYCYSAYQIAVRAPARFRIYFALAALLLPEGLYELAGGYRELFASALAIASLVQASAKKPIASLLLAVAAASISEELLPLIFLPSAITLASRFPLRRRSVTAVALAIAGVALFLLQWKFLQPPDQAAGALSYRFGPAPLGGASWAGSLNGLGLLPSWIPAQSPIFDACLFAALAAFPGWRFIRSIQTHNSESTEPFTNTVGIFVAFVGAFLLAFRGTDPNLLYSLSAIALWYFASADPRSPFPLLLGSIEGLAFYATVGLGEFVNQTFFWPVDRGLLGTLSSSRYVFDLVASALMLVLILSISSPMRRSMFSANTPFVFSIFLVATISAATTSLALDSIVFVAAAVTVTLAVSQLVRSNRDRIIARASLAWAFPAALIAIAGFGAYAGTKNGLAGFCATSLCLFAARKRLGLCDVVLCLGAVAVAGVQLGSGAVSNVGAFILVAILIGAATGVSDRFLTAAPARST